MSKNLHLIFFPLILFVWNTGIGQSHTPRYISMTSKTAGYYEYLPAGFLPGDSSKYPAIVYIHGNSERGAGDSVAMLKISGNGLPKVMREETFPTSFTSGGQEFRFIVISPQFRLRPTAVDIDSVLNFVLTHYPVDSSRLYLTGFSMGGASCWEYAGANPAFAAKIAALVPLSGSGTPDTTRARIIARANLPVWATHNSGDGTVPVATTNTYIEYINSDPAPTPLAKATIFNSSAHSSWKATYNPEFREEGLNVFEWMLQAQRSPQQASTTVQVNIFGGSNAFNNTAWNNWNVKASLQSPALKYSDFTPSTITATLSGGSTVADNGVVPPGSVTPPSVLRYASYSSSGRTLTLNGLSPFRTYDLELYASRNNTGNATHFETGGYSVSLVTDSNRTNVASFLHMQPSAEGAVVVTLQHSGAFNYLNGFTLVENSTELSGHPPPAANAGADQSIFVGDSVLLAGNFTHNDSCVLSFSWTQVRGPGTYMPTSPSTDTTSLYGLVEGIYTFRFRVTDTLGLSSFDDVEVVVLPAPPPAGTRFVKVNLFGGANPYSNAEWNNWNVSSSLTSGTLAFSDNASSGITASISKHTLSDNGASYGGTMAPPEVLRYTSYGTAARTLTLSGLSATKTYNLELYAARANTGHSTTFTVAGSAVTILTDNNKSNKALFTTLTADASGKLVVSIASVNTYNYLNGFILTENVPAPGAPTADAGPDQGVSLPGSTTTLSGAASDADGGTITGYSWAKLSGGAATLSDPTAASTSVSGLVEGVYTFRLTVTDNDGLTAFDDVQVVVAAAPPPAGTRLVKVNLFGGSNPYGSPEWNNWNVSSSLSSGGLKYSDAATSGISAALSRSSGINDNGAGYGSGMAPAEVLRHSSSSTSSRTLTISGLSADKTYALELYASRGNYSGNFTGFTVDGATQSISTFNNLEQRAEFTNLTASATGKITVSITNAQSYNYLNGFILTEVETVGDTLTTLVRLQDHSPKTHFKDKRLSYHFSATVPDRSRLTVHFVLPKAGEARVEVINAQGQVVARDRGMFGSGHTYKSVNMASLPPGIYYLKLHVGPTTKMTKVFLPGK